MHKDFLKKFSKLFVFPNFDCGRTHAFYGWDDDAYKEFMTRTLMSLEPRKCGPSIVLVNLMEEVTEVLFWDNGTYAVGFEISRVQKFVMKFKNSNVLGAYECTYNLRSQWIYKTITMCKGFAIRKKNWMSLLEHHKDIVDELKS
jgi:hypothetical protein